MFSLEIIAQTVTPWFTNSGMVGGILGGSVGILGGIMGTAMGVCAPRGIGKRTLLTTQLIIIVLGVITLGAGVVALMQDQPYAVYYPLLLIGGLTSVLFASLYPVVLCRYREAEQRKLNAEEFRTT